MRNYFIFSCIMLVMFFSSYALINDYISDEDQKQISQLINDTQLLKTPETEQEWNIFLEMHQYFVKSIISRINVLVYSYPFKPAVQDLIEIRDYLQNEMARLGL